VGSSGHGGGFSACLATLALLMVGLRYLGWRMETVRRPISLAYLPIVPPG
jgi:hypothetical protein